jgi:hypothetical protein
LSNLLGQFALNIRLKKKKMTATKMKRRKINVRGSANGNPNLAPINAELQSNTNNAGAALAKLLTSI